MISVPKTFRGLEPEQLAQRLGDFAVTLENQLNGAVQIHVLDKKQKQPRKMRRKDIVLRIKRTTTGEDALLIYWYNGKRLIPLTFATLTGQIDAGTQIANFNFLELDDTPDSYAGQVGKLLRVNALETAVEFVEPSEAEGGGGGSTDTDTCCEALVADGISPPIMVTDEDETDFLYSD